MSFGKSHAGVGIEKSIGMQREMYDKAIELLQPYIDLGTRNIAAYESQLAYLASPIEMDQATMEATPGYQFALSQGLKSTQNAAAAKGLGVSGAAMKGAGEYATGLANQTYKDRFQEELLSRQNALGVLRDPLVIGSGAAAGAANAGMTTAANMSNTWMQGAAMKDQAQQNMLGNIGQGIGLFTSLGQAGFSPFAGMFGGL